MKYLKHIVIFNILLIFHLIMQAQPGVSRRWDYYAITGNGLKVFIDDQLRSLEKNKSSVVFPLPAFRYKLIREYYAGRYEKIRKSISLGTW